MFIFCLFICTHLLVGTCWNQTWALCRQVVPGCPWWILPHCQVMLRIQQKIRQELAHAKHFEGGLGVWWGWKHVLVLLQKHRAMHVLNMLKWQESPSVADLRPTSRLMFENHENRELETIWRARRLFDLPCIRFQIRCIAQLSVTLSLATLMSNDGTV